MDKSNALNLAWAYVRYSTPAGIKDGGKARPAIVLQSGAESSTIFRCTSKDKSGKGFPTYALADWESYGLDRPTFVDLLYRYTISNSDIVRIASELTDRDMEGLLNALGSHAPKGEIDISGKDEADAQKAEKGKPSSESVKSEGAQAGKEPLRPFYEFLYDYLNQGMGFVFDDRPDAFEDALRYYGLSGDALQDKLDNADEGEIREFIVNHYVDTAPEGYEGNLENLKNVIDADEDPDSYAQGLSLLDKAFGNRKDEAGESEDGDGQCICESEDGQRFVIKDKVEYAREYADAVEATRKKSQGWQDKVMGMYSKYAKPTSLTPDQVLEYKEAGTKGEMLESLEGSDDLQGIVKFLIEDENEAVDGYDKAIKAFNAATLPTPDMEHIVSELQHIKEEELEHIRELEELLQYVPGSYVPSEQAKIAADAEDEASKEEAEGEEPSAPEGQGMGKEE